MFIQYAPLACSYADAAQQKNPIFKFDKLNVFIVLGEWLAVWCLGKHIPKHKVCISREGWLAAWV